MVVITEERSLAPFAGCVLVPTMGALHRGHVSLIERALEERARGPVVVSIFVNPMQFGPGEGFERYPRTIEADVAACEDAGADAVFAPEVLTVYPELGADPTRSVGVPSIGVSKPVLPPVATQPGLEDAARPGHFAGVCRVVARLFDLVRPVAAVFGEKDWQQLRVIRAMTADSGRAVRIIASPTVRDEDGLALSSRNVFLSAEERLRGLGIIRAIRVAQGEAEAGAAERLLRASLARSGIQPDYAVVRDAGTLGPPGLSAGDNRILVAARIGAVRLLDNGPAAA